MRRRESYRIGLWLPLSTTNCRFAVFSICSGVCNLRRFHTKLRSMDAQVLFRLFCVKTAQSHTAITSIVGYRKIHTIHCYFCHCENLHSRFAAKHLSRLLGEVRKRVAKNPKIIFDSWILRSLRPLRMTKYI